jgi:hypothetical protein
MREQAALFPSAKQNDAGKLEQELCINLPRFEAKQRTRVEQSICDLRFQLGLAYVLAV